MKSLMIFFTLLLNTIPVFAQTSTLPEEIVQFDIRKYSLEQVGVRDLVFEARIENLTETLNKNLALGKLTDVHFKIYWMSPDQWKIEVNGLPKNTEQIAQDLKTLIAGKLDYVLAKSLATNLEGLVFEKVVVDNRPYIKAFDPNYAKPFTDLLFNFDQNGKLTEIKTNFPGNQSIATYEYVNQSWSGGKLLISKLINSSKMNGTETIISHLIEYQSINGTGVPAKMTIKTINKTTIPARGKEKEKVITQELNSFIKFSKFEFNTGKAKRNIVEGSSK